MIETARVLGAALAVMFAIAAATKVGRRRGGWFPIVERLAGPRVASAAAVLMPAAEAAVAVALVVAPQLGLRAAAALLAVLGLGVARAVRSGLTGARCSCLGGFTRSRIGLPLAAADGALALGALGASLAPGIHGNGNGNALSIVQLLAGAAAFTVAMLLLRVPSRSRLRTGRRLRGLVAADGRSMVIVVVSPGCPPCERLAPELGGFAAGRSDSELVVVIGPGPAADRVRLANVVGASSRLDLERWPHRWQVPGTPWGIAVSGDGRVSGNGPAPTVAALAELCTRPPEAAGPQHRRSPAPEGALDRRSLLRALGAASVMLPSLGAVGAIGRTVARTARSTAGTATQENIPGNTFHGTCAGFEDFVGETGLAYNDIDNGRLYNRTDVGGLTQTKGADTKPPTIPASVIDRKDTWSDEQGGTCGCTGIYYPSFMLCTVVCPTGLECFGYQCQPGPARWCLTSHYGIAFDNVENQTDVLVWDPPADASNACKAYAAQLNAQFSTHEDQHVADALTALNKTNKKYRRLTSSACAPTRDQALAMVNAQIAANEQAAQAAAAAAIDAAATAFHDSPAGQPARLDCKPCAEQAKPVKIKLN